MGKLTNGALLSSPHPVNSISYVKCNNKGKSLNYTNHASAVLIVGKKGLRGGNW